MRAVQRARLWAITWTASQAPLAANFPEGRWFKPTPGSQLALFALYDYHAFITDRDGAMLDLEADHRRHAEIENAIRDLEVDRKSVV